jgi:hypothetical protein
MRSPLGSALLPLEALGAPGAAMDVAGSSHPLLALAGLLFLAGALGAASLPRLLALLAATLAPGGPPLTAGHTDALREGLTRYIVADRLLPPPPLVIAALVVWLVSAPVLAERGIARRAVWGVLAMGAAPLVVQRLGELLVVWATPGDGLVAGDVAGLAGRFNVGLAGLLSAAGLVPGGALSVVAEAANAIGVWVVVLWGWGVARLDRDASRGSAGRAIWPFVLAATAYGIGYAAYATFLPAYLMLVMGVP